MTAGVRRGVLGAPVVVAIVGGAAVAGWLFTRSPADRAAWYPSAADAAFEAGDYKTAAVCYARSMQSGQADAAAAYNLAVCWDQTGQPDAARGELLRLAPVDRDGYTPARLRLVKMTLAAERPTAAELDGAQQQLDRASREQADDPEASFWQAVLWANRGRWDAVGGAAAKAGGLRDVLGERLAAVANRQGNPPAAAAWAGRVAPIR